MTLSEDRPVRRPARRPRGLAALASFAVAVTLAGVVATTAAFSAGTHANARAAAGSSVSLRSVPRYYMTLLSNNWRTAPESAVIHDALTGKSLATVRPPAPFVTFNMVVGGLNDRMFVLAARAGHSNGWLPTKLYLARFNPARRSIRLTPLPIAEFPATLHLTALALSPDGKELAVALDKLSCDCRSEYVENEQIRTYALAGLKDSGPIRVWTGPPKQAVLWSVYWGIGTLAFDWATEGLRVISTDTRSGSLLRDSRLVFRAATIEDTVLTTDDTIVSAETQVELNREVFEEFSATTGRLIRTLAPVWPAGSVPGPIIWTNSSGSVLVTEVGKRAALSIVSGNSFAPISGAPSLQVQYALVAF